jgi:crotonobetaine/carnitine-CoA ligase|tara:strand:+ start:4102 stop:5685 length:1584 start_codon:yes stop_codon:yes gene_type:complete
MVSDLNLQSIVENRTLPKLLDHRAESNPDRTFLIFEDTDRKYSTWSYKDFNEKVNQVANALLKLKVKKGDKVNIHLNNCPQFLFGWFALSKIGAVMVPTNPVSPPDELMYPINHSESILTITQPDLVKAVKTVRSKSDFLKTILVTGDFSSEDESTLNFEQITKNEPKIYNSDDITPTDEAAILFTSGTTSLPKGVIVTHANYIFLGEQISKNVGLNSDDRWHLHLQMFHGNAQYYSTMTALTVGASIALMSKFSASRFIEQLTRYKCTVSSSLSTPMRMILAQKPKVSDASHNLRLMIFAQNLTVNQYKEWETRFKIPLLQIFGMTETMGQPLVNPLDGLRKNSSIGFPALGYQCRVVDESGNEVAQGQIGQLIVKGIPGITILKSYYKNDEATEKALKNGWLYTGDIVKVDSDGYYYFVDRANDLIRRSGENISAGEIESVIKLHEAIADAAVVGISDNMYDEAIIGFVTLKPHQSVTEEILKEYCSKKMSKSKIPEKIEILSDFPRTNTGKTQKNKLREMFSKN